MDGDHNEEPVVTSNLPFRYFGELYHDCRNDEGIAPPGQEGWLRQ